MIRVLRTWHQQFSHLATTIPNTKALMHFIDTLEEFRDLSLAEWNFMHLLKQHLESLLHYQNIYWKQRETIKWVKLGDECNTFFNANATISSEGTLSPPRKIHKVIFIPLMKLKRNCRGRHIKKE
jgi:hypothetical protein